MKKLMSLVSMLAVASLFAFAGCKKEEAAPAPAEKKAEETKPVEAAKPEEAKPAEAAAPAEAAKPAEAAAAGDTGIPECNDYLATADKFAKCDKLPKEAKDAQIQALEAAKTGWASLKDPNVPAEAKKAAADGCKQANEAMKQAWTAAGCQ